MPNTNQYEPPTCLFDGLREAALQEREKLRDELSFRELAIEIQRTKRRAFQIEDEDIEKGIEARNPLLILQAIEHKANYTASNWVNLGDPCTATDSDYSLDPHIGIFKENEEELKTRLAAVYDAIQSGYTALRSGNNDLAFIKAWKADRSLRKVEDFYVKFAELDGIVEALIRTKKMWSQEGDRISFQKSCLEYWNTNPSTPITGDKSIVYMVGGNLLSKYKESKLVKWAHECAPECIRNRRGRPKKKT
jgi:hypothetical protein